MAHEFFGKAGWQLRWVQGHGRGGGGGWQRHSRGEGVAVRRGASAVAEPSEEAGRCQNVDKYLLVGCEDSEKKT